MSETKQVPLEQQVATIETEVATIEETAKAMVIDSAESNTEATDILGMLTKKKKSIEEARKFFVGPLNDQVKAINAKFMPQTKSVDAVITTIKGKVGAYHVAEEERLAKIQAGKDAIRAKADAKRAEKGEAPIEAPVVQVEEKQQTTKTGATSATVKKVWKHRIISMNAMPDNIKEAIFAEAYKKGIVGTVVQKFVNAGMRDIEGVEIYQDTQVSVR